MSDDHLYRLTDSSTDEIGVVTETFSSTGRTHSPWGTDLQHGGPVGALLTRAMERVAPREGTRISRVKVDILGPVKVAPVRVSARTSRPGKRIELLESTLDVQQEDGSWRRAARGAGWRLATQPTTDVVRHANAGIGPAPVDTADDDRLTDFVIPSEWVDGGFVRAITWHVVHLGHEPGDPSTAWMRLDIPLVAGEDTSPTAEIVALADVANGLGARLDVSRFSFLNTDLDVQVYGTPEGPWHAMQAESSVGPDGVGMADGVLHGPTGPIGRVTQNLLVERLNRP